MFGFCPSLNKSLKKLLHHLLFTGNVEFILKQDQFLKNQLYYISIGNKIFSQENAVK